MKVSLIFVSFNEEHTRIHIQIVKNSVFDLFRVRGGTHKKHFE